MASVIIHNIKISYAICPSIFNLQNYKEYIMKDIIQKYKNHMYDNYFIIEVLNMNMNNIQPQVIDPITGNIELILNVKCKCLDLHKEDKLNIQITKILDKGIMGLCNEGLIQIIITERYLKDWTYNKSSNTWIHNQYKTVLSEKDIINVEIIEFKFYHDKVKCFAKFN